MRRDGAHALMNVKQGATHVLMHVNVNGAPACGRAIGASTGCMNVQLKSEELSWQCLLCLLQDACHAFVAIAKQASNTVIASSSHQCHHLDGIIGNTVNAVSNVTILMAP
eukprot:scaffold96730_cov23-Tisochrysis_lutea.AAC.1